MNWQAESWVKLYVRDNGDWLRLSFDAQCTLLLLFRKVDRHGRLDLGRDGIAALPALLGHRHEADRICHAVSQLSQDGCVTVTATELLIPNFAEAQSARTSNAERQRRFRELHKESNGALHTVTASNTESQLVTNRIDQNRIDQKEKKQRAREAPPLTPATALQAFLSSEWNIRNAAEYEKRMLDAFPGLDLLAEAKKARGYQKANPQKHYKNHGRYFYGWLGNAKRFAGESQPNVAETEKASARAAREIAETKQRNAALAAIKPAAMPAGFKELLGKIGNGK